VASTEAFRASYLRDLSLGGLFVRSKKPLPLGAPVVIELQVAGLDPVRLRGEVVRQEHDPQGQPRGFGVRFTALDEPSRASLEQLIRSATARPTPENAELGAVMAELAALRGSVEAYEESLAQLHERETEHAQRIEGLQAERTLLKEVAAELQARVAQLQAERSALTEKVGHLGKELSRLKEENEKIREASKRAASQVEASLARELQATTAAAELRGKALEAELATLRAQLAEGGSQHLRDELQELSAQLDDERLKSMALERALQRFAAMGGVVPQKPT
jgi:uncharacterized protein (TIGR02266 family)